MNDSKTIEARSQIVLLIIGASAAASVILILASSWPQQMIAAILMSGLILVAAFKPTWSLYLMALSLPIINWSFPLDGLLIPLPDLVALLSLIGYASRQMFTFLFDRKNFSISWPFVGSFTLFFIATLISSIFAEYPLSSAWYSVRWILFFYLAFIWLPINVITNRTILKRTIICLVIAGLAVALIGLTSLSAQDWQNSFARIKPTKIFGGYPIGENQNLIAEFLVILAFLTIALKQFVKGEQIKKWLNVVTLLFAAVAVGTFSRAGWIALYFQVFMYFIYHRKELIKRYFLPIIIMVMIAAPLSLYMLELQVETNTSSTESRLQLSRVAWESFLEHPIIGTGSGTYISLVDNNIRFKAQYGDPLDSHGLWQKVLAENGLLGIFSFSIFAFLIFKRLYEGIAKNPAARNILIPIVLAVSGGFIFQFFNTSYYKGKLWFPIALAVAAVSLASRSKLTHGKVT